MRDVPKRADLCGAQTLELARAGAFLGNAPDPAVAADVIAHVGALLRAMG